MFTGGISLKGSYHKINQDSYGFSKLKNGFVAVLADGLGSKSNSHYGSQALCRSVIEISVELQEDLVGINLLNYIDKIYQRWKTYVEPYEITECYTTMLLFVLYETRVFAIRLGDGFVGIYSDNQVKVLFDRKQDYFLNETDCFSEILVTDKFEIYEAIINDFSGGLLCSDGISIGDMQEKTLIEFTKDFVENYYKRNKEDISTDIFSWLGDWPGSDDKTLVYFLAEGK